MKPASVATSRRYEAAPVDEFQFAVNDVVATELAAVATGAFDTVICDVVFELALVLAEPTARAR